MATTDDTYQGWTNRETWLVNLWLNNEEGPYREGCRLAKWAASCGHGDLHLGEAIEAQLFDGMSGRFRAQGFQLDVLNAFAARVDWRAIGAAFRESVSA